MAIKRLDPNAKFRIVSSLDSAIQEETQEELEALKTGEKDKDGRDVLKRSRYERYIDSFDLDDLKFKEGDKPTIFVVKCLLSSQYVELSKKHQEIDIQNKRLIVKDRENMMLEYFRIGCLGIENEKGEIEKVMPDDIGYQAAVDIGAMISLMTTLGKNVKKA